MMMKRGYCRVLAGIVSAVMLGGCSKESPTAPTATVRAQGSLEINQTFLADLDRGVIINDATSDIFFEADTATQRFFTPRNGATVASVGTTAPGKTGCSSAPLSAARIDLAVLTAGGYVCVKTNEARFSQVRITGLPGPSPGILRIDFTTYD